MLVVSGFAIVAERLIAGISIFVGSSTTIAFIAPALSVMIGLDTAFEQAQHQIRFGAGQDQASPES